MAESAATSENLLRLEPLLSVNAIPHHPVLSAVQTGTQPAVEAFAKTLLSQGHAFASSSFGQLAAQKGAKTSAGSAAPVTVVKGSVANELWVGRRSTHGGTATAGDATWDEFDGGLRVEHSKHEMAYTPGVADAVEICDWTVDDGSIEGWSDVKLTVVEMQHKLPAPLKPRVFTVLVLTARATSDAKAFLVVSAPLVPLRKVTASKYANGAAANTVVHGAYSSVEHVYEKDGKIVWDMATVSDAKGVLPMAVQKLGIAGAIVKDVGLFLKWVADQRSK